MSTDSYLVIGGCGLLGRHIVDQLLQRGEASVAVFDISLSPLDPRVKVFAGDITDAASLGDAIQNCRPSCIIHTASSLPGKPRELQEKINIRGTDTVIKQAIAFGVQKLVYTSSASVVFNGEDQVNVNETAPYPVHHMDDYNDTKASAERLVLDANGRNSLNTVSLRPAGLFGPGDRVTLPSMMNVMLTGRSHIQIGDNKNLFDWTYIGNAAQAHLLAADRLSPSHPKHSQVAGQAFFITNGDPRCWWDFPRALWKEAGYHSEKSTLVIPRGIAYILASVIEFFSRLLGKEPSLTRMRVTYICSTRCCDITKARTALDYEPLFSLDEGIKSSVEWWKSNQIEKAQNRQTN
ncbi:hypothetical protein SERLA73DRAFT_112704 [Serpula lacrymans var. lacrymans S7.3]|uniref:3-beta hydroxysteroid dehydrogenase/isomerase domain-containing protein n=2 Tax=Serpula lacrymans var. lacrymans TaxID=341189 RepID=F8Q5D3_SERL3|nr:uncharacterized protein SERLADRAFT_363075 [Serpula lacrymans var. lacrymans S7.9]EGN96404.1 hypothetical protein SERLA73DRAFT_112704 [Serpula lacrymans var. lacrymans S7.3]EGO21944.1 hypothetical protein SERLADRAFT_363075 [Serpula lacrymans var. lacrymans S7.9]